MWFSGHPYEGNNRSDGNLSVPQYVARVKGYLENPDSGAKTIQDGSPAGGFPPGEQVAKDESRMERSSSDVLFQALAREKARRQESRDNEIARFQELQAAQAARQEQSQGLQALMRDQEAPGGTFDRWFGQQEQRRV